MESTSFESLRDELLARNDKLHSFLLWRDCSQDDSCLTELQVIDRNVDDIIQKVEKFKSSVQQVKVKVSKLHQQNESLKLVAERLKYMLNNIPERLPKQQKVIKTEDEVTIREPLVPLVPLVSKVVKVQENIPAQGRVKTGKAPTKQVNVYVPEIDFLCVDEFDQIPKYQKGRLTYDQINKYIEGFNLAFKGKYRIMKMKKSTMKDADRKRHVNFMTQENKNTAGCYFVVEDDLKDFGGLTIDSNARTIFTVLRHCGRIKEIRGGNLTRYRYMDRY